ncbi:hypothetical protein [Pseudoramibacter faecis]|uniref:hypothetical protein n=1 Tax=Pseudoramibacter faecis TaxID=3108534 RepID=UPI002E78B7E7|nr:hypothetical protein [Pseudoramibacter sp. HA2172]
MQAVLAAVSDRELNDSFIAKYAPPQKQIPEFEQIVRLNAQENGTRYPEVVTYVLWGNVYVGIELNTGYFQVECETVEKMTQIWDALFLKRGLNEDDIENDVMAAQWILLER